MPGLKFKRAGLLTKIVILALVIYLATTLLNLRGQIQSNESQLSTLTQQVTALTEKNQKISDAIDNSSDPEELQQAARDRGYVLDGEQIMIDVSN